MNFVSIQLNHSSTIPLYMQLFTLLKQSILNQEFPPGTRLPAIRTFATQLGVNNVTIINCYKQLELSNYITSKKGSGFYINQLPKTNTDSVPLLNTTKHPNLINFSSASPAPETFPIDSFKRCLDSILERDKGFAFSYQETNGFMPLRETLCDFLKESHGIYTKPELIQVVSGAQQGLDIISKACLNAGDYVITEIPTYKGATDVFTSRGSRIVTVSLTPTGIDLIDLEKKIRICKPKLLYIMSFFHNPTTICYSKDTLIELLKLANKYDFYIIEEDSISELYKESKYFKLLKSLDTFDRVIYSKSFSKLLMPGLRIGFLVIPQKLVHAFTHVKEMSDLASAGLIHRSLDLFFKSQYWSQHLNYMNTIYYTKYELMKAMLTPLRTYGISYDMPIGGLWFWIKLPLNISATKLYELAIQKNLLILPSIHFYPLTHKDYDRYIRISFAACMPNQIASGIQILEDCLQELSTL